MTEKLTIRNFGPIDNVELELKRFNVIIGEQATGKSTVAKVLAVCRYFSYLIDGGIMGDNFEQGLGDWGLAEFIKEDSFIRYECDDYIFSAKRKVDKDLDPKTGEMIFVIAFFETELKAISDKFKNLLKELEIINPNNTEGYGYVDFNWKIPTSFFQNDVAPVLSNPFYLHTERGLQSIFSLGKNSIQNIADSLFNHYANLDLIARNFINDIIIEPLNILYKNVDGRGYIKQEDKHDFLALNNSASGFKSAIPIVLVIKYYTEIKKKLKTFIIEEPELNLYPSAQKEIINFLADKVFNFNNRVLLTTHSPYILTSLNNLMYAYEVGKNEPEEVSNIIDKKYWINPEEVSAYKLLKDGTCENIIDRDEKLIKAEKIDEVSGFLNEQFDALLKIELVEK